MNSLTSFPAMYRTHGIEVVIVLYLSHGPLHVLVIIHTFVDMPHGCHVNKRQVN